MPEKKYYIFTCIEDNSAIYLRDPNGDTLLVLCDELEPMQAFLDKNPFLGFNREFIDIVCLDDENFSKYVAGASGVKVQGEGTAV